MRLSKRVIAASFLLSLVGSASTLADPVVSGAQGQFDAGSTVVISGSGFGTKTVAQPLVFDNFESGTVDALIAGQRPAMAAKSAEWVWDDYYVTERPRYSNGRQRANSSRNARLHFVGGSYNNSLEIFHDRRNSGDQVYFSFWYYYDRLSANYSRNHKPWVVYGSAGYTPAAYDGWGNPSVGDGSFRNSVQDTGTTSTTMYGGPNMDTLGGKWIRLEGYLRQSTPGVADGAFQIWSHDPDAGATVRLAQSSLAYITRSSSDYWRQWHFGSYHDNNPTAAEANVYIDDLYFDDTRARVELGDAPTWAGCHRREIQPATAWSNGNISVRFNRGAFAPGVTAYLYVVDANGVANSNGYPVVIGGEVTQVSPPMPPSAVNVQVN